MNILFLVSRQTTLRFIGVAIPSEADVLDNTCLYVKNCDINCPSLRMGISKKQCVADYRVLWCHAIAAVRKK